MLQFPLDDVLSLVLLDYLIHAGPTRFARWSPAVIEAISSGSRENRKWKRASLLSANRILYNEDAAAGNKDSNAVVGAVNGKHLTILSPPDS